MSCKDVADFLMDYLDGTLPFAQRMTFKLHLSLCPDCRRADVADRGAAALIGLPEGTTIWRAAGCPSCSGTGYAGRIGLYEVVRVDDALRKLIGSGADELAMAAHAFSAGGTLSDAARAYVRDGLTTVEEAVRVVRQEAPADADL